MKSLKNKGYLLIEVLVTIVVLGTAIVFVTQALSASLLAVRRATSYTEALLLVEQLFCDLKLETSPAQAIPLDSFPRSESVSAENQKFDWEEELQPLESVRLSEIIFRVFWKDSKLTGEIYASTFIPTTTLKGE
ncbi:MAG: type II secretion system protein [Candidatus Omnitrophota bacterium]